MIAGYESDTDGGVTDERDVIELSSSDSEMESNPEKIKSHSMSQVKPDNSTKMIMYGTLRRLIFVICN